MIKYKEDYPLYDWTNASDFLRPGSVICLLNNSKLHSRGVVSAWTERDERTGTDVMNIRDTIVTFLRVNPLVHEIEILCGYTFLYVSNLQVTHVRVYA